MKSITERLHENRQIQLAKEILENAGYKVSKRVREAEKLSTTLSKEKTLLDYADEFAKKLGSQQGREAKDILVKKVSELLKTPEKDIYWAEEGTDDYDYLKKYRAGHHGSTELGVAGTVNLLKNTKEGTAYVYHANDGYRFFYI